MAFVLLWLTVFIMFFQLAFVFPVLLPYAPLKYTALLALITYIISDNRYRSQENFFSSNTNRYFILFILMQILSASHLWVMHGIEIVNFWLRYCIVYFLIIKSATTVSRIKWISVGMVAGIAYLTYFSLSTFVVNYEPGMRAKGFGWYDNPNDLSIILVSIIPLSYLLFETSSGLIKKSFYLILTGLFVFNLLFTGSRNGLLGLFTVGMLSLILSKISKLLRLGLVVLLCSSILGIGLVTVLARSDLSALSGDESSENRLEQWSACGRMIMTHPFLGVGPDEAVAEMSNYGGIKGLVPHNTIIQVFAETGIPGGIFFFLFGIAPVIRFFKNIKQYISSEEIEVILYKYFSISLVGFWICAFFGNRVEGYQLYVLVALIVAVLNLIKKYHEQLPDNEDCESVPNQPGS